MKISFVIPAHNEEKNIGICIQSILDHWAPEFFEIIVANNASDDRTGEVARSFPGIIVVDEPRKGTNWARQAGFAVSSGDIIACLDADTQLPAGWRETVVKEFADPTLVFLSGPFHYTDLSPSKNFLAMALWYLFAPLWAHILGFAALGANMVIRRSALEKIHGFDTSILFHGDDSDTARRLSKVGKGKFEMKFYILGSGRRLNKNGVIKTFYTYGMNYLWSAYKHKPYTPGFHDIDQ